MLRKLMRSVQCYSAKLKQNKKKNMAVWTDMIHNIDNLTPPLPHLR